VRTHQVDADFRTAWLEIEAQGWGDGLPCVPPTPALVEEMLGEFDPDEVIAVLAPSRAAATNRLVAANAVMAGCDPAAMPVVRAALQALAEPEFNLLGIQSTTNPAAALVIVNGPIRHALGLESGASCMGSGRGNLTLGRAVRLALANIGNARPGFGDRASHGFPGKVGFCFAEAEEASPWEPLCEWGGLPTGTDAVTVVSASGTMNVLELGGVDDILTSTMAILAGPGSNDVLLGGTPVVVFTPEHAELLACAGWTKADVQRHLWEGATVPVGPLSAENREMMTAVRSEQYGTIVDETRLHVSPRREDLLIVVAGGPGTHTVYIPTFGLSRAVTRRIG
jgi:hypothetical protein